MNTGRENKMLRRCDL